LLAFLSLGLCGIPFAFIRYGSQIRKNSKFSLQLKEAERHQSETMGVVKHDIECMAIPHISITMIG
jgi:hypothetical protein